MDAVCANKNVDRFFGSIVEPNGNATRTIINPDRPLPELDSLRWQFGFKRLQEIGAMNRKLWGAIDPLGGIGHFEAGCLFTGVPGAANSVRRSRRRLSKGVT